LPEKEQILYKKVKVTFLHSLTTLLINILYSVQCHLAGSLCGLLHYKRIYGTLWSQGFENAWIVLVHL